ncbi:MAG: hypothetical protein ACXVCY_01850 [Pseudobdellovibrionaceae bacterium]
MIQSVNTRILGFCTLLATLSGCASINSVSLTPVPSKRNNPVKAEVSKTIFLGFNFDNDYINPLVDNLKRQCPNGVVSGILTKDETISYIIVHTKHIVASGFCNSATKAALNSKGPRKPSSLEPMGELESGAEN